MELESARVVNVEAHSLSADRAFPNNPALPLLVYRQVLRGSTAQSAAAVECLFEANGWRGTWRDGVYSYHHFHSNAHEVLGVCAGQAQIQFGGPSGPKLSVAAGDVLILPAGTGHKCIDASADFLVVGAYPAGQENYDLLRGEPSEQAAAERRIASVPLPESDPVYGAHGPLFARWRS